MTEVLDSLKRYLFRRLREAFASGNWGMVAVLVAALALVLISGVVGYALLYDDKRLLTLCRDQRVLATFACMLPAIPLLFVWWVASDPQRVSTLVPTVKRFRPRSVLRARTWRWRVLVFTVGAICLVWCKTWSRLPQFSDPDAIHIYVALLWDSRGERGVSPESAAGQLAIIEAIDKAAVEDKHLGGKMEVRSLDRLICPQAPRVAECEARRLGLKGGADLVVWGSVLWAENKEYMVRVTSVRTTLDVAASARGVLLDKDPCPPELASTPLVLAGFIRAYGYYNRGDYDLAVELFEHLTQLATAEIQIPTSDATLISFYLGNCYSSLPDDARHINLEKAICRYEWALAGCEGPPFGIGWAATQNNLGVAYAQLGSGDPKENLRTAIACFNAAAEEYARGSSSEELELVQLNRKSAEWRLMKAGGETPKGYYRILHYDCAAY